jgi:hypothetical protein
VSQRFAAGSGRSEAVTESGWLTSADAQAMLAFLQGSGRASDRKFRLFAVACCRSVWPHYRDEASRKAVEVAEGFSDGEVSEEELHEAGEAAGDAPWSAIRAGDSYGEAVAHAAVWATARDAGTAAEVASRFARGCDQEKKRPDGSFLATRPEEELRQAGLLRDIFGPLPFRPVAVPAAVLAWNGGCIVKLATAIYQDRDFACERMGVLADALEEAGLTDEALVAHLRSPGPHVRGCWAIDALLNRQ